ncbi:hypothetical protein [Actinokineospora inagensis]|uniref:hypothetical protein n=1 Tax=Actinokineospora inagensis TaxID=103730 RepID=UPI00047C092E|nr:hypothetical protein [Actinokineospora inagensis]
MTSHGEFAAHRRDGDDVIKILAGRHPAGVPSVAAAQDLGIAGMITYLSTLRAAAVILPDGLEVISDRPLTVRHRWVPGPVLLDHARVDPSRFVDAVIEVAGWVRALDGTDARVDTNLANFCLNADGVVLVDVLPPLIPSRRPEASSLFDVLFSALCFETPVILDALIGYATRALLHAEANLASDRRADLERQLSPGIDHSTDVFPASWFRSRAIVALRALNGDVEQTSVDDYFALTSVRAFRDLPEAARVDRVRQVNRLLRGES